MCWGSLDLVAVSYRTHELFLKSFMVDFSLAVHTHTSVSANTPDSDESEGTPERTCYISFGTSYCDMYFLYTEYVCLHVVG